MDCPECMATMEGNICPHCGYKTCKWCEEECDCESPWDQDWMYDSDYQDDREFSDSYYE